MGYGSSSSVKKVVATWGFVTVLANEYACMRQIWRRGVLT